MSTMKKINPGIQSLHAHTILSDGKLTHQESLRVAKDNGISVVAFTEHDTLPDSNQLKVLKSIPSATDWIIGIEVSANLGESEKDGGVHLLGLFIDPTSKGLINHCNSAQNERITRMKKIVTSLRDLGFDITSEDVLKNTPGNSVGQPHIVSTLLSKQKNTKLMNVYKEKMKKAAASDEEIDKKYQVMVQQGEYQYPYALFLKDTAFIPIKPESEYFISLERAVSIIRESGGISSIAHYSTSRKDLSSELLEELLKKDQLDGMETVFGFWGYGNNEEQMIKEDREMVRNLVNKYEKVSTGGADAHNEHDYQQFAENTWYSDETIGMTEKIIENKKPNLDYTSLK
jgi:hypothetical protein